MNKQQPKKQANQPAAARKHHDPVRTEVNKARRLEKDRRTKAHQMQGKADHKTDHGSTRFMKRARLSFLPGPKAKAVKQLLRATPTIQFTPERMFFQLGQRARLVGG